MRHRGANELAFQIFLGVHIEIPVGLNTQFVHLGFYFTGFGIEELFAMVLGVDPLG